MDPQGERHAHTMMGPLDAERVAVLASHAVTDCEKELIAIGHVSQIAYKRNFTASMANLNADLENHGIVEKGTQNAWHQAPSGVSNALRPMPTEVEAEELQKSVITKLALRALVEDSRVVLPDVSEMEQDGNGAPLPRPITHGSRCTFTMHRIAC